MNTKFYIIDGLIIVISVFFNFYQQTKIYRQKQKIEFLDNIIKTKFSLSEIEVNQEENLSNNPNGLINEICEHEYEKNFTLPPTLICKKCGYKYSFNFGEV